jgi:hypothetical protein
MIMGTFGRYPVETAHDHEIPSSGVLLVAVRVCWPPHAAGFSAPFPQAAKRALRNTLHNVIPVSA